MKQMRIQKIEKYIRENGTCSIEQLSEAFKVSNNTVRRDINELVKLGLAKKIYGGATVSDLPEAPGIADPTASTAYSEKAEQIARTAATLINDGDIILISSGTTTYRIVHYLKEKKDITIITNNLLTIFESLNYSNIHVITIGGDVLKNTNSIVGSEALSSLKRLNAHKAFLSTSGLSLDTGLTNSSALESEIKQAMIDASKQTIILADCTKFDTVSLYTFADFKDIDIMITDKTPGQDYMECFAQNHVQLIVAGEEEPCGEGSSVPHP